MDAQPQEKQRDAQPLFGTLLASRPARTRSPGALALSIVLHVVVLGLLAVLSRSFVPQLAQQLYEQITYVRPQHEDDVITFAPVPPGAIATAPAVAQRPAARPGNEAQQPLIYTPGPIAPIAPPTAGPETPEPGDGGAGGGAGRSLADRLRPRTIDPRLLPGGSYVMPDLSPAEAVRVRIAQSLQQYNDSVSAEEDAKRRATDWTLTTKDGKKWGISPGQIHLGGITLPLPLAFNTPPGRRDEANRRATDWAEIEAQANREIGRQSFKDRVKAIRARKEKEREEKKKEPATISNE